jgi:hypothetical protein
MSPRSAFALIMSVVYLAMGCALLFTNAMDRLIPNYRLVVGGVLLCYGALRSVIWWRRWRERKGAMIFGS